MDKFDRETAESWCRLNYGRCLCSEDGRPLCAPAEEAVAGMQEDLHAMRRAIRLPKSQRPRRRAK